MPAEAGELFVLIRPNATGFTEAAEGPIAEASKKLSKIFLAGFAIGGIAETIKSVVEAATEQNNAFAILDKTIQNAGAAVDGFSADLKDKLEKQARATGVSAEDLAKAMTRLVPATHDTTKATKDLNTAIGISEAYHISLSTAALALAKAETGSFNSLQRYLGAIPRVTTSVDALKARYTALQEAGGKLDASQKAQYESALKAAQAQDNVATAQNAIALATGKFAGTAQTYANTYEGQFKRLEVAVDQLKVAVGTELVSGLATAAGSTADFLDKLIQSETVQKNAAEFASQLGTAFHDIGAVLEAIGPPLLSVANRLGGVTRSVEVLGGVFAGAKIVGSLQAVAATEGAVAGSTGVATAAVTALTAALTANTAALTANSSAAASATVIYDAYGGVLTTVATEETVVGTQAEVAAAKVGIFKGAIAGLVKTLGTYLAVNQAIKALVPGQQDLGLDFSNNTATFVAGANNSPYQKGSPNDQLYQQSFALSKQGKPLTPSLEKAFNAAFNFDSVQAITAGQKAGEKFADGFTKGLAPRITIPDKISGSFNPEKAAEKASATARALVKGLADGVANDHTDLEKLKQNLADAVKQGAQAVQDAIMQAKQNLNSIGQSLATVIGDVIDAPLNAQQQRIQFATDRIAAQYDRLTAILSAKQRQLANQQSRIGLAGDQQTLRNLGQSILLPGGKTLSTDPTKALEQLNALGRTAANSPALQNFIQTYRSAALQVQQDQLGLRVSALDARRQAAETGLQLKSDALKLTQDLATTQKQAATRRIADLTDEFNTHAITLGQFQRRVTNVLVANGINRKTATAALGRAGGDQFSADVAGLFGQAGAIGAGPQASGSGLAPTIVRPLDTLDQSQKQIATAAADQRKEQIKYQKDMAKYLKKLAGLKAARDFVNSLDANPGVENKRTAKLAGVTN